MTDASLIDHLSTEMIAPALGTSPNVIARAVRAHTVATVEDLQSPSDQDLEAALRIVPLIAVGAARGAANVGAPFGAVMSAVMKGAIEGTIEIEGDPVRASRETAEALVREADRLEADLGLAVAGVVSGAAETEGNRRTGLTEAVIRALLDEASRISPETEETVEQTLRHTDYLPTDPIARILADRTKAP